MEMRGLEALFDAHWYKNNAEVPEGMNPFEHFLNTGWRMGNNPHPLFDVEFYLSQLAGPLSDRENPLSHFISKGATDGLDPHPLFDTSYYLDRYAEIVAGANPLVHYLDLGGARGLEPHPFFSSSHYLAQYPGVRDAKINPLAHYVMFGAREATSPHPSFDGPSYIRRKQLAVGANPLVDFALRLRRAQSAIRPDVPTCSIVILNWNRAHMTVQCAVEALETYGVDVEIIVVDNGSRPEEFAALTQMMPHCVRIVRLSVNRYFGEGNNIGVEASRGEYILLLNNDAFINADTVPALLQVLKDNPDAGIAGPKFLYPDGRIQEGGALVSGCGTVTQRGKFLDDAPDRYGRVECVDYISAACALIARDLFDDIGGFDLLWDPAYYEDVDLCLKALLVGKKTYYCGHVAVTHIENATSSDQSHGLRLNTIVQLNREKFIARWGAFLDNDKDSAFARVELPRPLCTYGKSLKRTAVLYTPYPLVPGGGERYLLTMAALLSYRYRTVVVLPEKYSTHRLRTMARELELDLSCVELATSSDLTRLPKPDLLICMGNEALPPIRAFAEKNLFICQFPFPMHPNHVAAAWDTLSDYDAVIVYSPFSSLHFRSRAARYAPCIPPVVVLSPPAPSYFSSNPPPRVEGRILNVGRFTPHGHCKRQDALIKAFRLLVDETGRQDLELHLVGTVGADPDSREYLFELRKLAKQYSVYFHVSAAPHTLDHLYKTSSQYWHGTGFGASGHRTPEKMEHFGISVLEAMSAGVVPLVYNVGGPADLVQDGVSGFHWGSVETLAQRSSEALAMPGALSEEMRTAARAQARRFDAQSFERNFFGLLDEWVVGMAHTDFAEAQSS